MSQWVSVKPKGLEKVKKGMLEKACAELHMELNYTVKNIKNNYGSDSVDCALVDKKRNKTMALGFQLTKNETGNTYNATIKGDFFNTPFYNAEDFTDQLMQQYRKLDLKNTLKYSGYTVSKETVLQNGDIELLAYSY